jgi:hypothetical protein
MLPARATFTYEAVGTSPWGRLHRVGPSTPKSFLFGTTFGRPVC